MRQQSIASATVRVLGVAALLAFAGLVPSVSCVQGGDVAPGQDQGEQQPPKFDKKDARYSLTVQIGFHGIEVLHVRPYEVGWDGAESVPASTEDSLRWEIRNEDGKVLAVGYVPDPRIVIVEPGEHGEPGVIEREQQAMFQLDVPRIDGTLYLFENNPVAGASDEAGTDFRSNGCGPGGGLGSAKIPDVSAGSGAESQNISGLHKVVDHGRCKKNGKGHLGILIVSEGYQQQELGRFRDSVDAIVEVLKRFAPFKKHWKEIDVWTLERASQQSGISDDRSGTRVNSYFGVSYGAERGKNKYPPHRCVLPRHISSSAASLVAHAKNEAHAHVVVYLANDRGYGGCRQGETIAMTVQSGDTNELGRVLAHELGHAVFRLADEYTDPNLCEQYHHHCGERNTTKHPSSPPWGDLGLGTPVAGAEYCTDIYRGESNCMMRTHHAGDFCKVCQHVADEWFKNHTSVCVDCLGMKDMCPSGTVCSYNGPKYGYCCRKPTKGSRSCSSSYQCPQGQVCAKGADEGYYCLDIDPNLDCPVK